MGIVAIFLLVTIGIVGVLVYRFDHILWMDKMSSLESDERSQASALAQSVSGDLRILSETFSLMAKEIRQVGSEFSPVSPIGSAFCKDGRCAQMLTILKLSAEGVWSSEKTSYLEKSAAMGWAENYLALVIKDQSHLAETKVGDVFVFPIQSPDRQTFLMTISPQTVSGLVVWFGALYPSDFFQSLVDINKGNSSQVLMVTNSGYALAHSLPEYIGQNFENDPIVKELMHTGSFSGSGVFTDNGNNPKHGVYEQVPHSNLYFAVSTTMQNILHSRSEKRIELGLLGLAIASIGVGILLYLNPTKTTVSEKDRRATETTLRIPATSFSGSASGSTFGSASDSPSNSAHAYGADSTFGADSVDAPAASSVSSPPRSPARIVEEPTDENNFVMQAPAPLPEMTEAYRYSDPESAYVPAAPGKEMRSQTNAMEEPEDDDVTLVHQSPRKPVIHMNESEVDALLDGADLLEKTPAPVRRPSSVSASTSSAPSLSTAAAPRVEMAPGAQSLVDLSVSKSSEPQRAAHSEVLVPPAVPVYDRPQFQFQKKSSKLDGIGFQIRKPGAKA